MIKDDYNVDKRYYIIKRQRNLAADIGVAVASVVSLYGVFIEEDSLAMFV